MIVILVDNYWATTIFDFRIRWSNPSEAKSLLKLARSEIDSTEKANSNLIASVETIKHKSNEQQLQDRELRSELEMSRQLIKRLQKEIEIYKEFLTKTSSTEAKNTETLVKLTEQNRALTSEKSKLEAKSSDLERTLCALKQENSKIEQLKLENSRVMKQQRYICGPLIR